MKKYSLFFWGLEEGGGIDMELEPFFDSFQSLMPTLGHDFVFEACILPLLRNAFDQRGETALFRDLVDESTVSSLLAGHSLSHAALDTLAFLSVSLEQKMKASPPFPTTADHWVLGIFRLVSSRNAEGALLAFANAGSFSTRGVGLAARVEALFALKRYDMVVASVIEADGVPSEVEEKKKSFAAKALQRVSSSLRGSDTTIDPEVQLLQTEDDAKLFQES